MTIDKLGQVDPVANYQRLKKLEKVSRKDEADSVDVSSEAKQANEIYRAVEETRNASDVRLDRIEEVKRKLADPNYINDTVVSGLADKLMEAFGIE
jgi:negative regulator of flagellin synthesis FlgM